MRVVESSTRLVDIPYGDYFSVEDRWTIVPRSSNPNACKLFIELKVRFPLILSLIPKTQASAVFFSSRWSLENRRFGKTRLKRVLSVTTGQSGRSGSAWRRTSYVRGISMMQHTLHLKALLHHLLHPRKRKYTTRAKSSWINDSSNPQQAKPPTPNLDRHDDSIWVCAYSSCEGVPMGPGPAAAPCHLAAANDALEY